VLLEQEPELVLVVGDVNSTLACTLVCAKIGVRVAHVEAGLRSFDPSTVFRTGPSTMLKAGPA
jgi:UDP-N-acetylglucosamine 2-epimerase (non-hydrolysing)